LRLTHDGRGSGGRAIGEMNIGELFSSVLMGKVTDMMGNLEGLAKTLMITLRVYVVPIGCTPLSQTRHEPRDL
jgi:hypothetical protein